MRWVWFCVGWPRKTAYQSHSNALQRNALLLSLLHIMFRSTIQKFNPVDNLEFCSTSRVSQHKNFPEPFEATIMNSALAQNLNFGSHAKDKRTHLWDSENEFYTPPGNNFVNNLFKNYGIFYSLGKTFKGTKNLEWMFLERDSPLILSKSFYRNNLKFYTKGGSGHDKRER